MSHNVSLLVCLVVCFASLAAPQLADFNDLFRLASLGSNSETRSDRSLTNSYPFNLGERQVGTAHQHHHHQQEQQHQPHHQSHNPNAARRTIETSGLRSHTGAAPASSFSIGRQSQFGDLSGFSLLGGFSGGNGQFAQHLFAAARQHQNHHQLPAARQVPAHHQHQPSSATSFIGPAQAPAGCSVRGP